VRAGGYAAIFALVLVKATGNGSPTLSRPMDPQPLAGDVLWWTGEILFLVVMAAYAAGILVVTARRPLAAAATLARSSPRVERGRVSACGNVR